MQNSKSKIFFLLFCSLILIGCARDLIPTPDLYVPPTLAVSPILVDTPPPPNPPVTSTPTCTNDLAYLDDVTIPDGTFASPGERLDKRWQVENSGTCNWQSGYTLRLIAGPNMDATPEQALYPARAGTDAVIQIIFIAPAESSIYRSAWQAYDPQGQTFGDPIFIEIVVP